MSPLVPESARFLLCKGRVSEALALLHRAAAINGTTLPKGTLLHQPTPSAPAATAAAEASEAPEADVDGEVTCLAAAEAEEASSPTQGGDESAEAADDDGSGHLSHGPAVILSISGSGSGSGSESGFVSGYGRGARRWLDAAVQRFCITLCSLK